MHLGHRLDVLLGFAFVIKLKQEAQMAAGPLTNLQSIRGDAERLRPRDGSRVVLWNVFITL